METLFRDMMGHVVLSVANFHFIILLNAALNKIQSKIMAIEKESMQLNQNS